MTRHKTPFSVAPSPPPAKTAANFQLFGFSMMKIDHHHPSLPPRISMHSIKSGWKMGKEEDEPAPENYLRSNLERGDTSICQPSDYSHIISFLL